VSSIGLILIDIDGTLVGPGAIIPDSVHPAFDRARREGVHLALCTGRPCSGSAVLYADLVAPASPHVFQSGAVVCHTDGTVISSTPFPSASLLPQIELARRFRPVLASRGGAGLEVYTATGCFVEDHTEWTLAHEKELGLTTTVIDDLSVITEPIVRVQWIVRWEEWPDVAEYLRRDPAIEVSVASHPDLSQTCFSSVTAHGISKASAAADLARHFGLSVRETAMVGDGDNDVAVLSAVGLPIAMGNGSPAAKAAAQHVVGNVAAGGLAQAIDLALAL
jgi:Cof subfamily protein (haloacid dehalogenase superfamily)